MPKRELKIYNRKEEKHIDISYVNSRITNKKSTFDRLKKAELSRDSEVVTYENNSRIGAEPARKSDNPIIQEYLSENLGDILNPVESVSEFLECVEKIRNKVSQRNFLLFRGTPTDFGICGRIRSDALSVKRESLLNLNKNENYLHADFVERIEKETLNTFARRSRTFSNYQCTNKWEEITLARHHGLPTRILDWSRDPLIGLWFAVTDQPQFRSNHSVITVFDPQEKFLVAQEGTHHSKYGPRTIVDDPFKLDTSEVIRVETEKELYKGVALYRPASISPRIDSQSSWFTAHSFRKEQNSDFGNYQNLLDSFHFPNDKNPSRFLYRVYVKSNQTYKIRRELNRLGINNAGVYKDLDALGAYVRNSHFKMSDEIFSDESLEPSNVNLSFKRLQSTLALYNSEQVFRLQFVNVKGMYQKLVRILSDNRKIKKRLLTINDMSRDFYSYASQREVFLRILEEKLKSKEVEQYKRVQYLNCLHFSKNPGELNEETIKKLYDAFIVKTDNISRQHVKNISSINNSDDWIKYEINGLKESFKSITYSLLEYEYKDSVAGDKKKFRHIIIELNHQMLNDLIGIDQDMCFWLEMNPYTDEQGKSEAINLYNKYKLDFDKIFDDNDNKLIKLDEVVNILDSVKDEINDKYSTDYLIIEVKINNIGVKRILIDTQNTHLTYNLQSILDYVYQRAKGSGKVIAEFGNNYENAFSPFRIKLANGKRKTKGWFLMNPDGRKFKLNMVLDFKADKGNSSGYKASSYDFFYADSIDQKLISDKKSLTLNYVT